MRIQKAAHISLVGVGVFVAIIGAFGMFGFGPAESIITLVILAFIDLVLKLVNTPKSKKLR